MIIRFRHIEEYPNDEFLGAFGKYDLWVDRDKDLVVTARWGDRDGNYDACSVTNSTISRKQLRLLHCRNDLNIMKAIQEAYDRAFNPDPSISPNSRGQ